MLSRFTRRFFQRFSSQNIQKTNSSQLVQGDSSNIQKVPVYLKPYDRTKYEVPLKKIKMNSGYAFLEIQPFPRAKIMKTCYHILEQLSIGFPQDSIYRIFNQQRTKYIMNAVDEIEDIEQLENFLGVETIELFIPNLVGQLNVIKIMRQHKIWKKQEGKYFEEGYMEGMLDAPQQKFPAYKKSDRIKNKFADIE